MTPLYMRRSNSCKIKPAIYYGNQNLWIILRIILNKFETLIASQIKVITYWTNKPVYIIRYEFK